MGIIRTQNGILAAEKNGDSFDVSYDSKESLCHAARSLVQRALGCMDPKYGFSTASCQTYDTAWVAMVCTI